MEGLPLPSVPEWAVPGVDAVRECYRVSCELARWGLDARDRGVLDALDWLTIGDVPPMSGRSGAEATWEQARAESWLALCVAARQALPTARDWERLGVEPKAPVTEDPEYAYGAWRTLAWVLGVREDWPVYSAWHRAAGFPRERPHMSVPVEQRDTEAWRLADQACRDQTRQDALRYWRHVRERADATDAA